MLPRDVPATSTVDRSACPSTRGHGTRWHRYRNGCNCPDGLADERRIKQRLPPGAPVVYRHVNGVGTMRRLQAAACAGYTLRRIGIETRISDRRLADYRHGIRTRVLVDNAAAVARVVDRLLSGPPPHPGDPGVIQSRARAAREGWVPLHEWLDVDDPHDTPDSVHVRVAADGVAAAADVRVLLAVGDPPAEIARRTGWTVEQVADLARNRRAVGRRSSLTVEQAVRIRREYLATRHTTWSGKRVAAREHLSPHTISQLIHGRAMPDQGFSDLTETGTTAAARDSDRAEHQHVPTKHVSSAASPGSTTTREETAA